MGEIMKKKGLLWLGVVLIISCLLLIMTASWAYYQNFKEQESVAGNNSQLPEVSETQDDSELTEDSDISTEVVIPETEKIRLMMLGDNLMHMGIVRTGFKADGTRNYDFMFEPLKDHLSRADIKIINQETIFGGNQLGFSGFPYFNSPTEIGDAIAKAGFNVVLHASNHSADQGIKGINHCLDFWEKYPDVTVTGIFKEADVENQDISILTINDVEFAILNYTYGPNMATLQTPIQGHLGMLCNWNKSNGLIDFTTLHPDVLTDIAKAKEMADVVIVCPHWGTEYTLVPSSYQKKFAMQMTEAGADLIIGTHPHVVQPIEWIEAENGNKSLCYYSLGNYVSTQRGEQSMLEAMAWVTFEVSDSGVELLVEETGVIPMVCQYKSNPVRYENVYFLDEYTDELAAKHGIHFYGGEKLTVENLNKWANEVFGDWLLTSDCVLQDRIETDMWK